MRNKRGMSGVVTALILIVLVLVAAGIVWMVYNNLIKQSAEDIEFSEKCLGIDIRATALTCDEDQCTVELKREAGSGGDSIDGVELTFSKGTESKTSYKEGNVAVTREVSGTGFVDATKVDVRLYFNKTEGGTYFCSQTSTYGE